VQLCVCLTAGAATVGQTLAPAPVKQQGKPRYCRAAASRASTGGAAHYRHLTCCTSKTLLQVAASTLHIGPAALLQLLPPLLVGPAAEMAKLKWLLTSSDATHTAALTCSSAVPGTASCTVRRLRNAAPLAQLQPPFSATCLHPCEPSSADIMYFCMLPRHRSATMCCAWERSGSLVIYDDLGRSEQGAHSAEHANNLCYGCATICALAR
jgi:hypothetical protein